jgi:hypothetical protein
MLFSHLIIGFQEITPLFTPRIPYAYFVITIRSTCLAHTNLQNFTTLIIIISYLYIDEALR